MIRLFVTVWKATVPNDWHSATRAMTTRFVSRSSAISQNPGSVIGIGLSQARMPRAIPAEATASTMIIVQ